MCQWCTNVSPLSVGDEESVDGAHIGHLLLPTTALCKERMCEQHASPHCVTCVAVGSGALLLKGP